MSELSEEKNGDQPMEKVQEPTIAPTTAMKLMCSNGCSLLVMPVRAIQNIFNLSRDKRHDLEFKTCFFYWPM